MKRILLDSGDSTTTGGVPSPTGALQQSLSRGSKEITKERAAAISLQAETYFGRKIQDIKLAIDQAKLERSAMLDMSPNNKMSLILVSDFKPTEFVESYHKAGVNIRNLEIQLEIAEKDYLYLFGKTYNH